MIGRFQIVMSDKVKKWFATFLTVMHLTAIVEAKSVFILGVHLYLKQRALIFVIGKGLRVPWLPFFTIIIGGMGMLVSSYCVYLLFRARVSSYRAKKGRSFYIAASGLILMGFTWMSYFLLVIFYFSIPSQYTTALPGIDFHFIYEGAIKESLPAYKENIDVKSAVDTMQMKLSCCGEDNYRDWLKIRWISEEFLPETTDQRLISLLDRKKSYENIWALESQGVPFSCCDAKINGTCHFYHARFEPIKKSLKPMTIENSAKKMNLHSGGCREAVNKHVFEILKAVTVISFINFIFNFSSLCSCNLLFTPNPTEEDANRTMSLVTVGWTKKEKLESKNNPNILLTTVHSPNQTPSFQNILTSTLAGQEEVKKDDGNYTSGQTSPTVEPSLCNSVFQKPNGENNISQVQLTSGCSPTSVSSPQQDPSKNTCPYSAHSSPRELDAPYGTSNLQSKSATPLSEKVTSFDRLSSVTPKEPNDLYPKSPLEYPKVSESQNTEYYKQYSLKSFPQSSPDRTDTYTKNSALPNILNPVSEIKDPLYAKYEAQKSTPYGAYTQNILSTQSNSLSPQQTPRNSFTYEHNSLRNSFVGDQSPKNILNYEKTYDLNSPGRAQQTSKNILNPEQNSIQNSIVAEQTSKLNLTYGQNSFQNVFRSEQTSKNYTSSDQNSFKTPNNILTPEQNTHGNTSRFGQNAQNIISSPEKNSFRNSFGIEQTPEFLGTPKNTLSPDHNIAKNLFGNTQTLKNILTPEQNTPTNQNIINTPEQNSFRNSYEKKQTLEINFSSGQNISRNLFGGTQTPKNTFTPEETNSFDFGQTLQNLFNTPEQKSVKNSFGDGQKPSLYYTALELQQTPITTSNSGPNISRNLLGNTQTPKNILTPEQNTFSISSGFEQNLQNLLNTPYQNSFGSSQAQKPYSNYEHTVLQNASVSAQSPKTIFTPNQPTTNNLFGNTQTAKNILVPEKNMPENSSGFGPTMQNLFNTDDLINKSLPQNTPKKNILSPQNNFFQTPQIQPAGQLNKTSITNTDQFSPQFFSTPLNNFNVGKTPVNQTNEFPSGTLIGNLFNTMSTPQQHQIHHQNLTQLSIQQHGSSPSTPEKHLFSTLSSCQLQQLFSHLTPQQHEQCMSSPTSEKQILASLTPAQLQQLLSSWSPQQQQLFFSSLSSKHSLPSTFQPQFFSTPAKQLLSSLTPDQQQRLVCSLTFEQQKLYLHFLTSLQQSTSSLSSDKLLLSSLTLAQKQQFFSSLTPQQQQQCMSSSITEQQLLASLTPEQQQQLYASLTPTQQQQYLSSLMTLQHQFLFSNFEKQLLASLTPVQQQQFIAFLTPQQKQQYVSSISTQQQFLSPTPEKHLFSTLSSCQLQQLFSFLTPQQHQQCMSSPAPEKQILASLTPAQLQQLLSSWSPKQQQLFFFSLSSKHSLPSTFQPQFFSTPEKQLLTSLTPEQQQKLVCSLSSGQYQLYSSFLTSSQQSPSSLSPEKQLLSSLTPDQQQRLVCSLTFEQQKLYLYSLASLQQSTSSLTSDKLLLSSLTPAQKQQFFTFLTPQQQQQCMSSSITEQQLLASLTPEQQQQLYASLTLAQQQKYLMFLMPPNYNLLFPTPERQLLASLSPVQQQQFIASLTSQQKQQYLASFTSQQQSLSPPTLEQQLLTSLTPQQHQQFFSSLAPAQQQQYLTSLSSLQQSTLSSSPEKQLLASLTLAQKQQLFSSLTSAQQQQYLSSLISDQQNLSSSTSQQQLLASLTSEQQQQFLSSLTPTQQQQYLSSIVSKPQSSTLTTEQQQQIMDLSNTLKTKEPSSTNTCNMHYQGLLARFTPQQQQQISQLLCLLSSNSNQPNSIRLTPFQLQILFHLSPEQQRHILSQLTTQQLLEILAQSNALQQLQIISLLSPHQLQQLLLNSNREQQEKILCYLPIHLLQELLQNSTQQQHQQLFSMLPTNKKLEFLLNSTPQQQQQIFSNLTLQEQLKVLLLATPQQFEQIISHLSPQQLRQILCSASPQEIVQILLKSTPQRQQQLLLQLTSQQMHQILSHLNFQQQQNLFSQLTNQQLNELLSLSTPAQQRQTLSLLSPYKFLQLFSESNSDDQQKLLCNLTSQQKQIIFSQATPHQQEQIISQLTPQQQEQLCLQKNQKYSNQFHSQHFTPINPNYQECDVSFCYNPQPVFFSPCFSLEPMFCNPSRQSVDYNQKEFNQNGHIKNISFADNFDTSTECCCCYDPLIHTCYYYCSNPCCLKRQQSFNSLNQKNSVQNVIPNQLFSPTLTQNAAFGLPSDLLGMNKITYGSPPPNLSQVFISPSVSPQSLCSQIENQNQALNQSLSNNFAVSENQGSPLLNTGLQYSGITSPLIQNLCQNDPCGHTNSPKVYQLLSNEPQLTHQNQLAHNVHNSIQNTLLAQQNSQNLLNSLQNTINYLTCQNMSASPNASNQLSSTLAQPHHNNVLESQLNFFSNTSSIPATSNTNINHFSNLNNELVQNVLNQISNITASNASYNAQQNSPYSTLNTIISSKIAEILSQMQNSPKNLLHSPASQKCESNLKSICRALENQISQLCGQNINDGQNNFSQTTIPFSEQSSFSKNFLSQSPSQNAFQPAFTSSPITDFARTEQNNQFPDLKNGIFNTNSLPNSSSCPLDPSSNSILRSLSIALNNLSNTSQTQPSPNDSFYPNTSTENNTIGNLQFNPSSPLLQSSNIPQQSSQLNCGGVNQIGPQQINEHDILLQRLIDSLKKNQLAATSNLPFPGNILKPIETNSTFSPQNQCGAKPQNILVADSVNQKVNFFNRAPIALSNQLYPSTPQNQKIFNNATNQFFTNNPTTPLNREANILYPQSDLIQKEPLRESQVYDEFFDLFDMSSNEPTKNNNNLQEGMSELSDAENKSQNQSTNNEDAPHFQHLPGNQMAQQFKHKNKDSSSFKVNEKNKNVIFKEKVAFFDAENGTTDYKCLNCEKDNCYHKRCKRFSKNFNNNKIGEKLDKDFAYDSNSKLNKDFAYDSNSKLNKDNNKIQSTSVELKDGESNKNLLVFNGEAIDSIKYEEKVKSKENNESPTNYINYEFYEEPSVQTSIQGDSKKGILRKKYYLDTAQNNQKSKEYHTCCEPGKSNVNKERGEYTKKPGVASLFKPEKVTYEILNRNNNSLLVTKLLPEKKEKIYKNEEIENGQMTKHNMNFDEKRYKNVCRNATVESSDISESTLLETKKSYDKELHYIKETSHNKLCVETHSSSNSDEKINFLNNDETQMKSKNKAETSSPKNENSYNKKSKRNTQKYKKLKNIKHKPESKETSRRLKDILKLEKWVGEKLKHLSVQSSAIPSIQINSKDIHRKK